MAVTPDKKAPGSFMLFFFASPKKNQKGAPQSLSADRQGLHPDCGMAP